MPEKLLQRLHFKIQTVRQFFRILMVEIRGDDTAEYEMLFIVWVLNTIVLIKKAAPFLTLLFLP